MLKNDYCVVLTTFADQSVGEKIIRSLIEKRLAACVQVQGITSHYSWQGSVHCTSEKLVVIKTRKSLYADVEREIIAHHNYTTPEIVQLPINQGLTAYLEWIDETCR